MKYEDNRKQEIWDWFHGEFIPPVECSPKMSEQLGTQYVCGGPYFADDVIRKEFGDKFPGDLVEDVIHDLESEETEWVKKSFYDVN